VAPVDAAVETSPEGAQIEDEQRIAAAPGEIARPPPEQTKLARGLRQGVLAGAVSLAMFAPLSGLQTTENIDNQLILKTRWPLLIIIVIVVAIGRFAMIVFFAPWLAQRRLQVVAVPPVSRWTTMKRYFVPIAIALLVAYPPIVLGLSGIQGSLKWVDNFGIQILIYVMLAWGLNVVVGFAGLLDLGYVAFYAVGAYSYSLLATHFGLSFWVLLPLAGLFSASWGIILGFPVLRLRGDYLAIVTLAFGEIIRLILVNWREVTNGGFGITSIPKVTFFGIPFNGSDQGFASLFGLPPSSAYYKIFLYYLILALAMFTAVVTTRLRRLPIGRAWESLREDEIACRSLGINTTNTKLTAFSIGAMFGGFAGSFFAARQGFVSPESFTFLESALIIAIVVLGGMGSMVGIAIAATVMIGGIEILRELTFLKSIFGPNFEPTQYRMLLFGLAMVGVMLWRPRGFVGTRKPTVFLGRQKNVSADMAREGHG
jgi:branched-chain amino acid transport system permease protein